MGKRGMRLRVVSNQDKLAGGRTRLILRDDPTGKPALSTQLPYLIRNESSSAHPDLPNNGYVSSVHTLTQISNGLLLELSNKSKAHRK